MATAVIGVIAALGWLAFGLLSLRLSTVKKDRDSADAARKEQASELRLLASESEDYRNRTKKQMDHLYAEIEALEDELESCATPGSRRAVLNRLLQTASSARDSADN